jgi:hypothetical protein
VEAVADLGQGIFQGALNTTSIVVARNGGSLGRSVSINDVKDIDLSLRETVVGNWKTVDRNQWEAAVANDPLSTFFTSNLQGVRELASARIRLGTLRDLVDDLGIQRGVTPDVIEAHLLTPEEAEHARIEETVLRNSLRGEDIKPFRPAPATQRLIYTTKTTNPKQVPCALRYLGTFRNKITCKEVKAGKHAWWRLHRPRDEAVFDRPKIIGLTTTRKVELVWDADLSMVVTDAMYVFAPRSGIPHEYLLGLMQTAPFAKFYQLANQGDARVIPQIKATKLLDVPIPKWDSNNPLHNAIVVTVRALLKLGKSHTTGTERAFDAQRRKLEGLAAMVYGLEDRSSMMIDDG